MLKLSLDSLQIVDAIDRTGSFTAAGKELFRVPSTISYAVSKLEEDLGVRIFHRLGPKVALTEAGKELLKEGRLLLRSASDLESRLRRVASGWETSLAIGFDALFSPATFSEDIHEFYQCAKQTRLRIDQGALSGTWEALLDRRVDLVIGAAGDGPSGGGYTTWPIGKISFVFAVAPSHPLAAIPYPLGKAELAPYRAISVADSARLLPARTVGVSFGQETLTVPDILTKFQFQLAGLGCGFLPEFYARAAIEAGFLIEKQVEEPKQDETFYLAWRTGESGTALKWWIDRIMTGNCMKRLVSARPSMGQAL